jgi:hypothetical protein
MPVSYFDQIVLISYDLFYFILFLFYYYYFFFLDFYTYEHIDGIATTKGKFNGQKTNGIVKRNVSTL